MEFDAKKVTKKIIEDIQKYYQDNHAKGAVVGISGGKDSAVVASLLVKALGKDNVEAFWLPIHSKESDKKDAERVCSSLGIELHEHDLTNAYEEIVNDVKKKNNIVDDDLLINANINIKPRLRINILYYYAAYYSALKKGTYLVCGTSNKSEIYVGYFTKGGDNICDIAPIKHLYVDEVIKVGDYLGLVPKEIIHKIPDDGISGQSDEERLGFSYDDVKKVSLEEETGIKNTELNDVVRKKIINKHQANLHKLSEPIFRR